MISLPSVTGTSPPYEAFYTATYDGFYVFEFEGNFNSNFPIVALSPASYPNQGQLNFAGSGNYASGNQFLMAYVFLTSGQTLGWRGPAATVKGLRLGGDGIPDA